MTTKQIMNMVTTWANNFLRYLYSDFTVFLEGFVASEATDEANSGSFFSRGGSNGTYYSFMIGPNLYYNL